MDPDTGKAPPLYRDESQYFYYLEKPEKKRRIEAIGLVTPTPGIYFPWDAIMHLNNGDFLPGNRL